MEKAYPKLIHYNKLDKGGHFAAWEQPKAFVNELRVGLKSLRYLSKVVRRMARVACAIRCPASRRRKC